MYKLVFYYTAYDLQCTVRGFKTLIRMAYYQNNEIYCKNLTTSNVKLS